MSDHIDFQTQNVTTTDAIRGVLRTALNDVFTDAGKELKPMYPKYLKELKTDSAQLITQDYTYFNEVPQKPELNPMAYDDIVFGNVRITEAAPFALGFKISREAMIALSKKPAGDFNSAKIASYQSVTKAFRKAANHTRETLAANIILLANSGTQTARWIGAGRDNQPLASNAHKTYKNPELTVTNIIAGQALSQAALNTMIQTLEEMPTKEGHYQTLGKDFLLMVPTSLRARAYEVVNTPKAVDSNNNNVNALDDFNIRVMVNPYLGDFGGFALIDLSNFKGGYFNPVKDQLDEAEDTEVLAVRYFIYFQWIVDYLGYDGIVWCPGP